MFSVTTDVISPRDRAEFWADLVSRHVRPMRIEPAGDGALRGEIEARPLGELRMARVSGAGVNALHTRAQIARGDGQLYAAAVSLEGEARITRPSEIARSLRSRSRAASTTHRISAGCSSARCT
jgi:hypothetical protein